MLKAAALLALTRLALWVIPLRLVRRLLRSASRWAAASHGAAVSQQRIGWAVSSVGRVFPGVTCLAPALATEALLSANGYAADLCIGVAKTGGGALDAHAWVESEGEVIIGALADLSRYTRLPRLPGH